MTQKDDDFTEELFVGSTHDYMLFMTNQGRVYRLKGYQVPEGSRTAKGSHIVNLLQLQEGEKVTLMLQQKAGVDEDNTYATMVTKQGLIKRTPLSQFRNIRKMGLIAIALNEGDSLVWSHLTKGDDEIIVATHDGAAIRFTEDGARSMGRTGHGVRVIKLREGDYVVGAGVCRPGANVLTISEEGKGRRSRIDDYRITKRGGLGIRNYSNGNVAGIKIVDDTDDLILISQNGILIRSMRRTSTSRAAMAAVSASCAWSRTTRWPWSPAWTATTTPRPQKSRIPARPTRPPRSWRPLRRKSWRRRPRRTQPPRTTPKNKPIQGRGRGSASPFWWICRERS